MKIGRVEKGSLVWRYANRGHGQPFVDGAACGDSDDRVCTYVVRSGESSGRWCHTRVPAEDRPILGIEQKDRWSGGRHACAVNTRNHEGTRAERDIEDEPGWRTVVSHGIGWRWPRNGNDQRLRRSCGVVQRGNPSAVIRHPKRRGCGCADTPWILEVCIAIDSTVDDAVGVDQWFLVGDEIGLDKTGGEGNAGRADKCAEQRGGGRTSAEVLPCASRFGCTGCERRERACVAPEGRRGDHEGSSLQFLQARPASAGLGHDAPPL